MLTLGRTTYYNLYKNGVRADGVRATTSAQFDSTGAGPAQSRVPYPRDLRLQPRVEGRAHLRFVRSRVAACAGRTRREDFRTEVLGLVKAQMVKNTVIVPVGSKGGFYCKQPADPAVEPRRVVQRRRGLLQALHQRPARHHRQHHAGRQDRLPGQCRAPRRRRSVPGRRRDKGTATFSDIANGIAAAHKFWLDDAFASGGSVGYDHKGMGITARGGWESVKRHFRAMGRDCQKEDFTCVGVGDMSATCSATACCCRSTSASWLRSTTATSSSTRTRTPRSRSRNATACSSCRVRPGTDYDKDADQQGRRVYPRSAKSIDPDSPESPRRSRHRCRRSRR
jgi:glutamate dehydrogenase